MRQSELRRAFKSGAHYGPYPTLLLMADGESLCINCARENARLILQEVHLIEQGERWPDQQWTPAGWYEHLEGPAEQCANCYRMVESAYGDPDEEES